ncbi:hypothetical protein [Bradyrhizobium shewense]|uniref:hypothetical protein n=1 Tax=Bradyrhizobium shewense TaxID=1761772 RepID=UPI00101AE2A7|nr:hypothetical protein [Bradyrhizobium shewense]
MSDFWQLLLPSRQRQPRNETAEFDAARDAYLVVGGSNAALAAPVMERIAGSLPFGSNANDLAESSS